MAILQSAIAFIESKDLSVDKIELRAIEGVDIYLLLQRSGVKLPLTKNGRDIGIDKWVDRASVALLEYTNETFLGLVEYIESRGGAFDNLVDDDGPVLAFSADNTIYGLSAKCSVDIAEIFTQMRTLFYPLEFPHEYNISQIGMGERVRLGYSPIHYKEPVGELVPATQWYKAIGSEGISIATILAFVHTVATASSTLTYRIVDQKTYRFYCGELVGEVAIIKS